MTEWNARDYNQQSTPQQAMAAEALATLTLAGNERALDIGCGDGKVTAAIAARLPHGSMLGVDPSRDMIAFATKHFGPPAHPNLRFEVGDARSLPYRNEFDLIVSFNALHWVRDQDAALRSIRAALKPQGRAALRFVPAGPSLEDVIEEVRALPRWAGYFPGFQTPFFHPTIDEYRALAERNGLKVADIRIDERSWDFRSREAFTAFCRATFVEWTRLVPADRQDAFIGDVLERYCAIAADCPAEENTFKFYQMQATLVPAE